MKKKLLNLIKNLQYFAITVLTCCALFHVRASGRGAAVEPPGWVVEIEHGLYQAKFAATEKALLARKPSTDVEKAHWHNLVAYRLIVLAGYDSARQHLQQAQRLLEPAQSAADSLALAQNHDWWSEYHFHAVADHRFAELHLHEAIYLKKALLPPAHAELLKSRSLLAVALSFSKKLDGALALAHDNLRLYATAHTRNTDPWEGQSLRAIGLSHWYMYTRLLPDQQKIKASFQEALGWFRKALRFYQERLGENNHFTAYAYHNIGNTWNYALLFGEQGPLNCLDTVGRALAIRKRVLGEFHPYTAACNLIFGIAYDRKNLNMTRLALQQAKFALQRMSFQLPDPTMALAPESFRAVKHLSFSLEALSYYSSNLWRSMGEKEHDVHELEKTYRHLFRLNSALLEEYFKQSASGNNVIPNKLCNSLLDQLGYFSLKLFQLTNDEAYLSQALLFFEQREREGHSRQNRASLKVAAAASARVLEMEELNARLTDMKRKKDFLKVFPKINDVSHKVYQLRNALEKMEVGKRSDRPLSLDVKQGFQLSEMKMRATEAMVSYHYIDGFYHALVFSDKGVNWVEEAADRDQVIPLLHLQDSLVKTRKNIDSVNYLLYRQLIEPIQPYLQGKEELIFVPGNIGEFTVPWAALLTELPSPLMPDPQKPYLARTYAINLAPTHLGYLKADRETPVPIRTAAQFAPFAQPSDVAGAKKQLTERIASEPALLDFLDARTRSAQHAIREALPPLPFSALEAHLAELTFGGTTYWGNGAKESGFYREVQQRQPDVLTLSTHGLFNAERPEFSALVMAPEKQGNDGFLFLYELLPQHIRCELALLPACHSGRTKRGVYAGRERHWGMGEVFLERGAKSTLSSHWVIDDAVSGMITLAFLKNLAEGKSKAVALQQAQLSYLNSDWVNDQPQLGHPYYWSGVYFKGNPRPLKIKEPPGMFEQFLAEFDFWGED